MKTFKRGNLVDKIFADQMIEKFQKAFYGYALSKTYTIEEAEELAARIVLEAYVTLLKVDDIYNWEGYLYRIACNIYARYVKEIKRNSNLMIDDMEITSDVDFTKDIMQSEEYKLLKREIAWLSRTQERHSNNFHKLIPAYPDSMIRYIKEKLHLMYETEKMYYPKHMHKLAEYYSSMNFNRITVLDELVKRGVLKPLTEQQRKGVMTIVFSDVLPK